MLITRVKSLILMTDFALKNKPHNSRKYQEMI